VHKSPAEHDSTRPHARQVRYEESDIGAYESDEDPDSDCGDEDGLDEDIDASAHAVSVHDLTAQDWKRVPAFSDIMHERYSNFDIDRRGKLRVGVVNTLCDFFLAFFPLRLVAGRFNAWHEHAEAAGHSGISSLDTPMFLRFLATLVKMSLSGLRRREMHFRASEHPVLSQGTFESPVQYQGLWHGAVCRR
jgi:hypothetical protein